MAYNCECLRMAIYTYQIVCSRFGFQVKGLGFVIKNSPLSTG